MSALTGGGAGTIKRALDKTGTKNVGEKRRKNEFLAERADRCRGIVGCIGISGGCGLKERRVGTTLLKTFTNLQERKPGVVLEGGRLVCHILYRHPDVIALISGPGFKIW